MGNNPFTVYPNVRKAALDIHDAIKAPKAKKFTMRPWNQYKPENTIWWLVPTKEWPAYSRGKAVILWEPDSKYFFGLVVEKGLNPKVREFYKSKKGQALIMDDTWSWYNFLEGIEESIISKAALAINEASNLPVKFEISSGIVDDPALFEPYAERDQGDRIVWEYYKESFKLTVLPERFLSPLSNITSIKQLSKGLQSIPELDWLWVDFYIGVSIPNYLERQGEVNKEAWDGYLIWEKIFVPLDKWLL